MNEIVFEYRGMQLKGQIISSTGAEPHYHWVYFMDNEVVSLIHDDCIGFKKNKASNQLQPTAIYTTHLELIETVKALVEKAIC